MNCYEMIFELYLVSVCAGLNLMNNVNCCLIAYFVGLVSSGNLSPFTGKVMVAMSTITYFTGVL